MKKFFTVFIAAAVMFVFAACSSAEDRVSEWLDSIKQAEKED